jgi:predicted permease
VLNHGAWVRRFGADPAVVGSTITLDERPHTIVGVMPKGFDFPAHSELWTPVVPILSAASGRWDDDALTNVGVLFVVGRLADGVTPAAASDELDRIASGPRPNGAARFSSGVQVTPFLDYLFGPVRPALWLLFAAVGVLLLIACANISALMLGRASLRRRELAVRLALGATRATLRRLWMFETFALSIAGGVLGLLACRWIAAAIARLGPDDIPRVAEVAINLPVAAFTCVVVLVTSLLCGVAPIRHASATSLLESLNDAAYATPGRQVRRARSLLLMLQIALAVVLLIGAGLVVRSFANLRTLDLGFTPSGVLTIHMTPRGDGASGNAWFQELLARIGTLSGVQTAGAIHLPPLALGPIGQGTWFLYEGQPDTPEVTRTNPLLNYQVASPGYFRAMGIALRRGRLFEARDDARGLPVAIIGETTANRLWPGEDPIGKRVGLPDFVPGERRIVWRTIVGVVADVRYHGLDDTSLDIYDPAQQAALTADHLVVRTRENPLSMAAAIQAAARSLDSRVVIDRVTTLDAVVARAVAPWRLSAWMFTLFATLAALLAALGLFSLVSLDAASRRRELAVRIALGAVRRDIIRLILTAAGRQVTIGVMSGLVVAMVGTRALQGLLFGVDRLDAVTHLAVIVLIVGVVGVASYVPARRAAGLDPSVLLRRE